MQPPSTGTEAASSTSSSNDLTTATSDHDVEADQVRASGLEIVQCRNERLALELFDVGAMVFFLRKVVWTVPDFSVDRYRARLQNLRDQIERDGVFRSTMSRTLLEARKPPST